MPGLVLIFFGVGAWVTALVCLVFDIDINTQLFIFLGSSLLSLALLRRALKKRYMNTKETDGDDIEDEYIGQTAVALNSFTAGQTGKVSFKGSSWHAESNEAVSEGQLLKITGYTELHRLGFAHSAEVWQDDELVGGLYGIRMGNMFFGESMFSKESNASKYAFIKYIQQLQNEGVQLIDCQVYTEHLESLGAEMIPRSAFMDMLKLNKA